MNDTYALRDRGGRVITFQQWLIMQTAPAVRFVAYSLVGEHEVKTEWSGLDYFARFTHDTPECSIFESRVYAAGERVIRFGGDHAAPVRMLWATVDDAERGHMQVVQRLAGWLTTRDGTRPPIVDAVDWREASEMSRRLHTVTAAH